MQRFLSALSLTILLYGVSAVAQVQTPLMNPIDRVVAEGWMSRSASGDFRANEIVTRAELASILVRAFQLNQRIPNQTGIITVQDVPTTHWAYDDIQTVLRTGVMTGYGDNRFLPEQRINRAEGFAIFAQSYGVAQLPDSTIDEILSTYTDASEIPGWARKAVATALYAGFVNVGVDNRIDPLQPMTRGDLAYALSEYLEGSQEPINEP